MSYTEACKGYYSKHKLYWVNVFERIGKKEKILPRYTILTILLGVFLYFAAFTIISDTGLAALFLGLILSYPIYVMLLGVHTMYAIELRLNELW